MKRHAPAAERNREAILAVLRNVLPDAGMVLEIASGTGQHAAFFADELRGLTFQPSDVDPPSVESIRAYVQEANRENLRAPLVIDVTADDWGIEEANAMLCANMIHIAPWACAEGLFRGAGRVLSDTGVLLTYGPYRFEGSFTAPSNASFDASLRSRDPSWGVRDVVELKRLARENGLTFERAIEMPANNHVLVFRQ